MLRFGCFKHWMGIMYDHHILIFGQNSLLLHGGVPRIESPVYPHFVFFLNKTLIKHLVFWGRVYRKEIFLFAIKRNFPQGGTPVKNITPKYHSAVPHENSAFKISSTRLMLNSENISYILCKISHLLQSIAIIQHVSAQTPMPKRTISHRRLLFVHYPLKNADHSRV